MLEQISRLINTIKIHLNDKLFQIINIFGFLPPISKKLRSCIRTGHSVQHPTHCHDLDSGPGPHRSESSD